MPKTEAQGTRNFFIGANAAGGFVNYADEIFGPLRKVHIIKGGPGTGKSTLLKRVATAAEAKGYRVERYHCSSDSNSLDGVVIRELSLGLTDGTSPHVMEAKYPGAREELLDLGVYWDEKKLSAHYEEIKALGEKKGAGFASVYKYLGVASTLRSEYEARLMTCIDEAKADAAAERLVKKIGKGNGFSLQSRQVTSLGMNGQVNFDSYEKNAALHYRISDTRGLAPLFFEKLIQYAEQNHHSVWVSRDPLGRPDALFFPEKRIAVTGFGDPENADKLINTDRFVRREALSEERARLRFLAKLERELYSRVNACFAEIRHCHFALEALYAEAMDFSALETASQAFLSDKLKL